MRRFLKWAAITVAALTLLFGSLLFATAARLTEGALHPQRVVIPAVCPAAVSISCKSVAVTSGDGTVLKGWYFQPAQPNGAAVIVQHGIGASRVDMVNVSGIFLKAGYAVLTPDLRGHGESGGITTYGLREEDDIHVWADWLLNKAGADRLYAFGASLGGSVVLESLRKETRFRAVIAESAFADFPDIAVERLSRQFGPKFAWLAQPVADDSMAYARIRYGLNFRQASALDSVREAKVPILLIHGLADHTTSPVNSERIEAANPVSARLWLVPKAAHVNAWETTGREFEVRVTDWFNEHP